MIATIFFLALEDDDTMQTHQVAFHTSAARDDTNSADFINFKTLEEHSELVAHAIKIVLLHI